jgi:hypothetical protein
MTRFDGVNLLKRRLRKIAMVGEYSPHSFRATGITRFLEEGGTLEAAQHMADHADSRTTKLYDRRGQKVLREDVERIRYWSAMDYDNLLQNRFGNQTKSSLCNPCVLSEKTACQYV